MSKDESVGDLMLRFSRKAEQIQLKDNPQDLHDWNTQLTTGWWETALCNDCEAMKVTYRRKDRRDEVILYMTGWEAPIIAKKAFKQDGDKWTEIDHE